MSAQQTTVNAYTLGDLVRSLEVYRDLQVPQIVKQMTNAVTELANRVTYAENALCLQQRRGRRVFRMGWQNPGPDAGLQLFHQSYKVAGFDFMPFDTVLEIGGMECAWAHLAQLADPTLHIIDVDWRNGARAGRVLRVKADIRTMGFAPETFDWVVGISSIEHLGLGYYNQDPVDADGDGVTLHQVARWLKPGGSVYLDVPWHPSEYSVRGQSCRVYTDDALRARLIPKGLTLRWQGYSPTDPIALTPRPEAIDGPFWYTALWLQKDV